MALGVSSGIVAHRKVPGFWRASVVGGLAGTLLWIIGALAVVVPTEGLGWGVAGMVYCAS